MIMRLLTLSLIFLGGFCAHAAEHPTKVLVLVAGASGRLGQHVIKEISARQFRVRGLTRDPEDARAKFGTDYDWVEGDLQDPASVRNAMQGVTHVISAVGAVRPDGPGNPEHVDYNGVINLIDAAVTANVQQFILVSSIGVTQRFHLLNLTFGDVLKWKAASEGHLRDSGLEYTIVRPGGLRPGPRGVEGLTLEQGDKKGGSYIYIPDLAVLLAWLVDNPAAKSKTFEVLSDRTAEPLGWQDAFSMLTTD